MSLGWLNAKGLICLFVSFLSCPKFHTSFEITSPKNKDGYFLSFYSFEEAIFHFKFSLNFYITFLYILNLNYFFSTKVFIFLYHKWSCFNCLTCLMSLLFQVQFSGGSCNDSNKDYYLAFGSIFVILSCVSLVQLVSMHIYSLMFLVYSLLVILLTGQYLQIIICYYDVTKQTINVTFI